MNSTLMTTTALEEDTFTYRHKKFDQFKRTRTDSFNSSLSDEGIKLETDSGLNESIMTQTTDTDLPNDCHSSVVKAGYKRNRLEADFIDSDQEIPTTKRNRTFSESESSCTSSFSPLLHLHLSTSTPIPDPAIPPTEAILPKISDETLRNICKYHGNMVRKFPKKERTPKDQERRNKNTIACRMSRRVKKLEYIAIEEQYKEFTQTTFEIIEQSMRATVYLHNLMKLSACPQNTGKEPNENATTIAQQKKPFTIAFLMGNEGK